MSRCAVTGATGYVGTVVSACLKAQGHDVLELVRRPSREGNRKQAFFDLALPIEAETLRGVEVLVHCAYDFEPRTADEVRAINVEGSRRLLSAADAAGVSRIILISTLSAFTGCRSLYGNAKLAIERDVQNRGGVVIRPGLVFGSASAGMVGALDRVVTRLPVVPLIGGGNQLLYLCRDDDLARLVEVLISASGPFTMPFVAAAETPITLRGVLEVLAEARGFRCKFVSVPHTTAYLGLRLLEALGIRPRFSSDSLVSLSYLDPQPDFTATHDTGIAFHRLEPIALGRRAGH